MGNKVATISVTAMPLVVNLPTTGNAIIILGAVNSSKAVVLIQSPLAGAEVTHFITAVGVTFSVNNVNKTVTITNTNPGNVGTLYGCVIPLP